MSGPLFDPWQGGGHIDPPTFETHWGPTYVSCMKCVPIFIIRGPQVIIRKIIFTLSRKLNELTRFLNIDFRGLKKSLANGWIGNVKKFPALPNTNFIFCQSLFNSLDSDDPWYLDINLFIITNLNVTCLHSLNFICLLQFLLHG